jgi:hypothetical protein
MLTVLRSTATAIAAGFLALPAVADEKKPVGLTPEEVAEGWILLYDGATKFGWKADEGVRINDEGALVVGAKGGVSAKTTASFGEGELRIRLTYAAPMNGSVLVITPDALHTIAGAPGKTEDVTLQVKPKAPGPIILSGQGGATGINRVAFRPAGMKTIFNGKDLSGWKVFPGEKYKSKYEVTKDGELRVTNGPGDLQTEGKYADFLLQLQCKTNGKGLNSGVFFRCIADQYQNGYEAQIHNGYKEDRSKPADFGTGAIYRRIAARKVVADDNEWFTMTVVANGPHISTWVNGYQTVDWTDDRQPDPNPRKGLRTEAGHLSIQGHDPTTDILFRNIRIVDMKK